LLDQYYIYEYPNEIQSQFAIPLRDLPRRGTNAAFPEAVGFIYAQ